METIVLDISGMKCAGCVRSVEKHLLGDESVKRAQVNLLTGVAAIEIESTDGTDAIELAEKLTAKGFPSTPRQIEGKSTLDLQAKHLTESRQLLSQLIIAGTLLILSAIGHLSQPTTHLHHDPNLLNSFWWHGLLATIAIAMPGRSILIDGMASLGRGMPNMNTLIGLGTVCSYSASVIALLFPALGWECFFEEPVMIIGFILLGRTLEQQAKHRAAQAFIGLLSLQPVTARTIPAPNLGLVGMEIPVELVRVGEYLSILPGEKIPADGKVLAGETTIDESMLTGESLPIAKQIGSPVVAGSINQTGAIAIEVQKIGADTALAQILRLVETAQTRKSPIQSLADRVAGYFTYGVLCIAGLTLLFWYTIGSYSPFIEIVSNSLLPIKTTIAVITIACPCALGLATPTAILVGTGVGAKQGLLFKGGDVLDAIGKLDTIAFDKTGTLTVGKPQVTDIFAIDGNSTRLLQLAAAAETTTNHPLALAIQQAAIDRQLELPAVVWAKTSPGLGATAHLATGETVLVGNDRYLTQQNIAIPTFESPVASINPPLPANSPLIHIAIDGQFAGSISIVDTLRDDAAQTVKELQGMGLNIVSISGDKQAIVDRIALELGIDRTYGEVLPADKAQIIQQLQADGKIVAMVGDGINDAPALAQADVGIAMNAGTDVAIEVADLILMRDRLSDVARSIYLARATTRKIRQNLVWAVIYNCLGIPAAAGIFYWFGWGIPLSPSMAGAIMALSSVSVVLNSLLLSRSIDTPHR
jgi:P-type Cu2+ transporter